MPSECDSSDYSKEHDDPKWNIFEKKGLHVLHLNVNSLITKIDEIRFIVKQSNDSIIEMSESSEISEFTVSTSLLRIDGSS